MRLDIALYILIALPLLRVVNTVLAEGKVLSRHIDLFDYIDRKSSVAKLNVGSGSRNHTTAYYMRGANRSIKLSKEGMTAFSKVIVNGNAFTISATIKQNRRNQGSIFSLGTEKKKWLAVESNTRRRRVRFFYALGGWSHVVNVRYSFADSAWHRVVVVVTRRCIQLYIDCEKMFEKRIEWHDKDFAPRPGTRLWIGQRNRKQAFFKGAMESINVVDNAKEYTQHCPGATAACTTCTTQIDKLEQSIQELHSIIKQLNDKLLKTESRISELERCDCRRRDCRVDGVSHRDGETWRREHCTECVCKDGRVECGRKVCEALDCPNPVLVKGRCCPICLKHCYYQEVYYEHGEGFRPRACSRCVCQDGRMTCSTDTSACPVLACPESQQEATPDGCCKHCVGKTDFCTVNDCHQNASCISLSTRYACQCDPGFAGDGKTCTDIDECLQGGGVDGQHCQANCRCVNQPGSYTCRCLPGYSRTDRYNCHDTNECELDTAACADHAVCVNTAGSYACRCQTGYHGDGKHKCTSTDDCRMAGHLCYNNSICHSVSDAYHCRCKPGFNGRYDDISRSSHCDDIDECAPGDRRPPCPPGASCRNTPGGYVCVGEGTPAAAECRVGRRRYDNGSWFTPESSECDTCQCLQGVLHCRREACDCSAATLRLQCCPQCLLANQCRYLSASLANGDFVVHNCHMCRCWQGKVTCWVLACPSLQCRHTVRRRGDCCARCARDSGCRVDVTSQGGGRAFAAQPCHFQGRVHDHGDTWRLDDDVCSACQCKFGHVCCSVDVNCTPTSIAATMTSRAPARRVDDVMDGRDEGGGA